MKYKLVSRKGMHPLLVWRQNICFGFPKQIYLFWCGNRRFYLFTSKSREYMKSNFAGGKLSVLEICKCFKPAVSEKLMYRSISTQTNFLDSYTL
jgi:hypothetical protein